MQARRTSFDLFVCLSLFNLLLLRVWAQILPAVVNPANLYYMKRAPHWIHYPAVLLTLFAAGGAACALAAWARNSPRRWPERLARAALLIVVVLALNSVRAQLPPEVQWAGVEALGRGVAVAIGVAAAAAVAWLLLRRPGAVFGAVEALAILGTPFLVMTVGQALWAWIRYDPDSFAGGSFVAGEPAAKFAARPAGAPRVIAIVFDELGQRAAFSARHESVDLPEFDRLRRESFFAARAFAPADGTRQSVASMLLGKQVSWAMPSGPSTLPCAFAGGSEADAVDDCWTAHRTLFDELRDAQINAGISGWYHPYCRIFNASVSACAWAGLPYWDSDRLVDSLDQQWHELVKPIPIANRWLRPGARIRRAHRDAFAIIREAALPLAADPSIGFALLHFPVPHHPDIYDPDRGELSIDDERSYFDNLVLTDRTLGELRSAMEAASLWEASTVIVTSDHWWRAIHRGDWGLLPEEELVFDEGRDRRIPFLVKFPHQQKPLFYPKLFNTLLFHDLVLEIFAQRLASAPELAAWLDANRSRAPIPYLATASPRQSRGRSDEPFPLTRRRALPGAR